MTQIRERKHRLPRELYKGVLAVAFTVCIKKRVPLFTDESIVNVFKDVLLAEASRYHCDILAYVFMPDHLHAILQGTSENAQPLSAMNRFKQKTGFWLSKYHPDAQWQKDYYDHIVRDEKEIVKHVRYILENPVRKGIVADWIEYKYIGSTIHDLAELEL